jgi:hypothetical protein
MDNYIITFGDTIWIQVYGKAMGTPAAPLHSILMFSYHENTNILPTFKSYLIYYKQFNDIYIIWLETPDGT